MALRDRIERLEQSDTGRQTDADAAQKAYTDAGGWRPVLARKGLDVAAIDAQVSATGCSPAAATAAQLGMTSEAFRQALEERGR